MKVVSGVLRVVFVAFLVWMCAGILEDRYQGSFGPPDSYPFERGNAPDDVRSEIIETLEAFQEGYTARDVSQVVPFAESLFARDNISILGTMPQEIYIGFENAIDLVRSDWQYWGDCRFAVEKANISSQGDVAWFSTVGYVEFDITSLLVLPLRLSGVLTKEDTEWRMQHLQFQFDLDIAPLLLMVVLLVFWVAVELMALIVHVVRIARKARTVTPDRAT
jgi:hypothetical protein